MRLCKLSAHSLSLPQLDQIGEISEEPATNGMNAQHETLKLLRHLRQTSVNAQGLTF